MIRNGSIVDAAGRDVPLTKADPGITDAKLNPGEKVAWVEDVKGVVLAVWQYRETPTTEHITAWWKELGFSPKDTTIKATDSKFADAAAAAVKL